MRKLYICVFLRYCENYSRNGEKTGDRMTTKKLKTEPEEINDNINDNFKALQDESSYIKKGNKKRKRTVRDSISSGRMFGR